MADPRIETVAQVLRDAGHNATGDGHTTDDIATMIVNALDREHGDGAAATDDETAAGDGDTTGDTAAGNPETPVGTGTEGGTTEATA